MATRRGLLRGLGGLAFCTCCMQRAARAQTPPRRLPITVAGQRVRTIDVHSHCLFLEALALMGTDAQAILPPTKGVPDHFIEADQAAQRMALMDDMAIDMEVLSINPFWYRTDRATAAKIVDINNSKLAELSAAHPDRFAAFASLSLQYPDLAAAQLQDAMKKGLRGAAIGASVLGESFAEPRFYPVWAKAEELGAVLFIHPQAMPELGKRLAGNGWLANTAAYPMETTLALQHMIFEGVMDRFPGLKLLAAHGGGYFPSYAPRADHACFVSPQNCNPGIVLKKAPSAYLDQMWFDTLVFTPEAVRHLAAQVGPGRLTLGTDAPIPWELHPADLIFATETLSDSDRVGILGGNAARLFGMAD
jgi:aminocarboxymuconate-semialdehyde decarboxylase